MRTIDFKNIWKLFCFNFFTTRKVILGWSIAITGIMFLYMILFPSIEEMGQMKMDAMPEELLQLFGMEDNAVFQDFTTYYSMIFGLILVAVAIFAATYAAGLIHKEEKFKSIEFLSTLAVSRQEIYISKFLTYTIAVTIVLAMAVMTTIVCGFINGGETFQVLDILASAKITSFTALFFGAVGLFLAAISSKLGTSASMVVLVSYLVGYLGQLLGEDGEILTYFSPFLSLNVENTIALEQNTIIIFSVYFVVYILISVIGGIAYAKRDLKV